MDKFRKFLQSDLQTKLGDLVSLFGDLLRLILVGVVYVGFQVYLGALLGCERIDSEVLQFGCREL